MRPGDGIGLPVLFSAVAAMLVATLVSGAFPALRLGHSRLNEVLMESGRSASPGRDRHRLLGGLVVGQLAISVVLLAATGLAVLSFRKLMRVDPGFSRENAICFRVDPFPDGAVTRRVIDAVSRVTGVRMVGGANHELLNDLWSNGVRIVRGDQGAPSDADVLTADFWRVTSGYFSAAGIPLVAGRAFDARDPYDSDTNRFRRVMINEALARQLFGGQNPVGQSVRLLPRNGAGAPREIIGVVASIKHHGLQGPDVPIVYWHSAEAPTLIVRTVGDPKPVVPEIRAAIRRVDPELIMSRVFTTEEIVSRSMADRRFATFLMLGFAALGTLLAVLGLYGVTSYVVGRRTREIGVRMALGAQRHQVVKGVLSRGMRLAGLGIALGLLTAIVVGRGAQSLLYEVRATDPMLLLTISAVLAAIALVACFVPAWRAAKVDPMEALRNES
jgi:putative ABC transport system permease protein